MVNRCRWVPTNNKLYCDYHDKEWGKPIGDDQKLFELLCLESYQSGLSWLTVLNKRQAFNRVFHDYNIFRFNISVNNLIQVHRIQYVTYLTYDFPHITFG